MGRKVYEKEERWLVGICEKVFVLHFYCYQLNLHVLSDCYIVNFNSQHVHVVVHVHNLYNVLISLLYIVIISSRFVSVFRSYFISGKLSYLFDNACTWNECL